MPVSTATGFSVIDTYNTIREDMQTSDYEEFDTLDDQQGVPQFSFSSSSSSSSTPPSFTFPTAAEQTTTGHGVVPQQVNSRYSSPSPCFSSPSPSPSPSPCPLPPSRGQGHQSLADVTDQQLQSLLNGDMDVSAGFLDDLIWPSPSVPVPVPVQPAPALSPSPITTTTTTTTTTTRTNYVAEAAAAGCTVVQTNAEVRDQQLGDMDMADLYDLDRHHSFYDDTAALDSKVKDARSYADWTVGELELTESPLQQLSPVGPSLTELGPVAGNEQEDLLSAFDSLRRDILLDCKQLNISPNPKTWSAEDSRSWTTYMLDKAQRSDDCSASLALAGPLLCQKSRDELLWASPSSGDFLHDQLQLWIALADLPSLPSKPAQQQQNRHPSPLTFTPVADFQLTPPQSGATLSHLPPSVSPAPSTDSACSSQSSSSSSSSSLSSFSDAEMTFWGQENPGEDLFLDSVANLTPADQPQPTVPSTPSTSSKHGAGRPGKQIRLWEFLKELLQDNDPAIKWLDRARGIFKIEDSNRVARLWGSRKNHPAMNYDKLSRSVRQYYKKGIIKKTAQTRRLVYQFCERYL